MRGGGVNSDTLPSARSDGRGGGRGTSGDGLPTPSGRRGGGSDGRRPPLHPPACDGELLTPTTGGEATVVVPSPSS
uniref:Uncharacterized protein n=1 Tax=Oryza punctata TaxID=4537 RepID=A0A0E0L0G1_ORYPU